MTTHTPQPAADPAADPAAAGGHGPETTEPAHAGGLPRIGDVFNWRGLDGTDDDLRRMHITGCSLAGRIQFEISFAGEKGRGIHDASLADVLVMIASGMWVLVPAETPEADDGTSSGMDAAVGG